MHSSWDYQRLSEACKQEGCILCRLIWQQTRRYLQTWKDELFTDVDVREELRHSQGFCHTHTWQLAQMGASLPLAQAYRDILSDAAELLASEQGAETRRPRWFESRRTSIDRAPCPACQHKNQTLARLVTTLREALPDPPFYPLFIASHGLCLPHFQLTCTQQPLNKTEAWLPQLRQAQLACLQRVDEQLTELIRKHDYRFKDEPHGDEMISWQRAAGLVAGANEGQFSQ